MGKREEPSLVDFDKVLARVGIFGRYQVLASILLSGLIIPAGMHAVASVFEAASPDFICDVGNATINGHDFSTSNTDDVCESLGRQIDSPFANDTNRNGGVYYPSQQTCRGFIYDTSVFTSTIVTRWNLVCSRAWMKAFSTSMFMLGNLVGVIIFGHVADKFGRKCLFWLNLALVAIGSAVAFAPNYLAYTILRFGTGSLTIGITAVAFTLGMEITGEKYRIFLSVVIVIIFAIGVLILAGLAYFIRDYVWLQLIISLYAVIHILPLYWIGESPRWMLRQGKLAEAEREIQRMARINGREIPSNVLDCNEFLMDDSKERKERKARWTGQNILVLLKPPRLRYNTFIVWVYWVVTGMLYYGLSLASGDLAGSPFLNVALTGIVELPAIVIVFFTIEKWGRKPVLSGGLFVGGAACLFVPAIPHHLPWLVTTLVMIGKFFSAVEFTTMYIYTGEIYPTPIRAIGIGAGSMFARIGSLLAPFVVDLSSLAWPPFPMVTFGSLSLVAGALSLLLPETLGHSLLETVEDGEKLAKTGLSCSRGSRPRPEII